MFGRLIGSIGAGMLGGLVAAVMAITLDTPLSVFEARSYSLESTVNIDAGSYLLTAAVLLAVFGAIRGGKPVNASGSDSVVSQQV
jgi:hypothetical protein